MDKFSLALFTIMAFGLMAFSCEGKAPIVHICKSYVDQSTCVADQTCKWKEEADGNKCKAR